MESCARERERGEDQKPVIPKESREALEYKDKELVGEQERIVDVLCAFPTG